MLSWIRFCLINRLEGIAMKTRIFIMSLLIAALTFLGISTASAIPPECMGLMDLEEKIECAITEGLEWIVSQQQVNGSFGYAPVSTTGLACLKLTDRGKELFGDPFSSDYEYADDLVEALDFIFSQSIVDVNGIHFADYGSLEVYSTGIAAMCIAATEKPERVVIGGPLNGMTYQQVLQGMVNWLIFAQNEGVCEVGGWGYSANHIGWSDNSNSGYASIGLGFAQSFFGMDISAVLPGLDTFINNVQDTTGGIYDGGSDYNPCWAGFEWRNTLKTGNLLYELGLVGEGVGDDRVDRAVDFIERYWDAWAGVCDGCGWKGDYQAMFTMMKGLEALGIDELDTGSGLFDWFEVVATYIVDNQNDDGSWQGTHGEGTPAVIDTAWALLTLEKVVPEITKQVPVDIKPGSCPNPLNVKSKGVLPVAVLGTEDFDVTTIDPATIKLSREGIEDSVSPIRWSYEDVATPFEGELCDCHELTGDGYMDLSLKFDTQELVNALKLNEVPGETIELTLTGSFKEEYNGIPIEGKDCMWVLK